MKTSIVKIIIGSLLMISSTVLTAQEIKDSDGNTYKTISYGVQVWTAANLNVAHFSNGDAIPEAATEEEWINAAEEGRPAWCYYDNDAANGAKFGKLYNWFAINDPRGLAPEGWRVPDNNDWRLLVKNLLGVDMAGIRLKNTTGWKTGSAKNDIGFSAAPSGYRLSNGKFREIGSACRMWSNSVPVEVKPSNQIYSLTLEDKTVGIKYLKSDKGEGLTVRCIRIQPAGRSK